MILAVGLLVSFLGQLPIGYINLIALKTAINQSIKKAMLFALGVTMVELLYLYVLMYSLHWIFENSFVYQSIQTITAIVFIVLGCRSFLKWKKNNFIQNNTSKSYHQNAFLNGVFLSSINLAQFPFWILWTSYLINIKWLPTATNQYPLFIFGTGLGTFLGILVYIIGGKYLLQSMKKIATNLELLIAIFFIVAAVFQIYHLIK